MKKAVLLAGNLIYAFLVTPALKLGGEVLVHDLTGHVLVDETSRHDKHVGIVMLADEMGNLWNPAETSTYGLVLVERHVDAFAAATDSYSREHLASLDATRQSMAEVAVVARLLSVPYSIVISSWLLSK